MKPTDYAKDAFYLIDKAEAIANRAVGECRAMTLDEQACVAALRAEATPLLERAAEFQRAVRALNS